MKKTVGGPDDIPKGWHPLTSVKYEPTASPSASTLDEEGDDAMPDQDAGLGASDLHWTPTGTGGYPEDWTKLGSTWKAGSLRTGVLGLKMGMTHTWDAWGKRTPLTAIQLKDNVVVEPRTTERNGIDAVVVAAVDHTRPHKARLSHKNMYESRDLSCKQHSTQFKVSPDALLPTGTMLNADHFVPGQYVDVISKTKGKGTAGVMKRHNMKGGNASHGATKMHRKMGATGGGQDPGRIWPGKRMAGRMGNKKTITHSLQVYKIDTRWNIVFVKGCVPGGIGNIVKVSDARRKPHAVTPPYPTSKPGQVPIGIHVADPTASDPGLAMRT